MAKTKHLSEQSIEKVMRETIGSMALEGMKPTEEEMAIIKRQLMGEISGDEARAMLLAKVFA